MKLLYGVQGNWKDITEIAMTELKYHCLCASSGQFLRIPANTKKRNLYFGDPVPNVAKSIWLNGVIQANTLLFLHIEQSQKGSAAFHIRQTLKNQVGANTTPADKLKLIHQSLAIHSDNFSYKSDIQLAIVSSLSQLLSTDISITDNDMLKIREPLKIVLTSNTTGIIPISLIIAAFLDDDSNFIVYETNDGYADKLKTNKNFNEFAFTIKTGRTVDSLNNPGFNEDINNSKIVINLGSIIDLSDKGFKRFPLNEKITDCQIWTLT